MCEISYFMTDLVFMRRALELSRLGRGIVSPNPMVGCVIVYEGKIIGEGYHQKYGDVHAEVNAISSVKDQSLLKASTAYVTLEPCAHYGKTTPCVNLFIEKELKKVVIACKDPFEQVNGKGIQKLKEAGIEIVLGILEEEAKKLNERFFTFHHKKRPYIVLKWAETSDGYITRKNNDSKWISNQYSRQLVHKWRTEEDAILVGKNTAILDNPSLTSRKWKGKNPIRVLLDSRLEVPQDSNIFNKEAPVLVFNTLKNAQIENKTWIKVNQTNPHTLLGILYDRNIQSIIIEGGTLVLNAFINENYWDEARVFRSKKIFGGGVEAPVLKGNILDNQSIFEDQLTIYQNPYG